MAIVVKLELWPGGDKERARTMGILIIANDGTGTASRGNYDYQLLGKQAQDLKGSPGQIKDYPKLRKHAWELVRRILCQWNDAQKGNKK